MRAPTSFGVATACSSTPDPATAAPVGSALEFRVPEGGLALWAQADDAIDLAAWIRAGEAEHVRFADARRFDFHQRDSACLRLGYGFHDETELAEAVRRMSRALKRTPLKHMRTQAAA